MELTSWQHQKFSCYFLFGKAGFNQTEISTEFILNENINTIKSVESRFNPQHLLTDGLINPIIWYYSTELQIRKHIYTFI